MNKNNYQKMPLFAKHSIYLLSESYDSAKI